MDSLKHSKDIWNKKIINGYGIKYPEGHVIRDADLFKNKHILDFGCGNYTHAKFFNSLGSKVVCYDTSKKAIEICKKFNKNSFNNLIEIEKKYECDSFDVIFANQVIYYLSINELEKTIQIFLKLLKKNGIMYFTYLSKKSLWFKKAKKIKNSDYYELTLNDGHIKEKKQLNFLSKKKLLKICNKIKKNVILKRFGYYDIHPDITILSKQIYHEIIVLSKN